MPSAVVGRYADILRRTIRHFLDVSVLHVGCGERVPYSLAKPALVSRPFVKGWTSRDVILTSLLARACASVVRTATFRCVAYRSSLDL